MREPFFFVFSKEIVKLLGVFAIYLFFYELHGAGLVLLLVNIDEKRDVFRVFLDMFAENLRKVRK